MGTTLVNQVAYDFQSIETEFVADGTSFGIIDGLDKFDYTVTINRTEIYGRSRLPILVTEGDAAFDASIDVHRYWFNTMVAKALQLGVGLADLEVTMAFSFFAKDFDLVTDTLTGVKLKEIKNTGQHGPEAQMTAMPLRVGNIYFAGVDIFGNKL